MMRQEMAALICLTAIHLLAMRLRDETDERWKAAMETGITWVLCVMAVLWTIRSV